MHQSVLPWAMASIEMCTLEPDSLLTGLPGLVKATGSFSETKACNASLHTDNKRPSSPAAIYLPFQFMSPFISRCCFQLSSCLTLGRLWKKHVDFWQHAGFFFLFFFFTQNETILSLDRFLWSLFWYLGTHQGTTYYTQVRVQLETSGIQAFCLLHRCVGLSWRCRIGNMGGERREEKAASSSVFVSIMCHGRSRLPCSVWLSLLLQRSPLPRWESVSLRGRRGSLLHQFQVGSAYLHGLGSHLPDTRSSADTSSLHGLSWLTGSCPCESSGRGHAHCFSQSPSLPTTSNTFVVSSFDLTPPLKVDIGRWFSCSTLLIFLSWTKNNYVWDTSSVANWWRW